MRREAHATLRRLVRVSIYRLKIMNRRGHRAAQNIRSEIALSVPKSRLNQRASEIIQIHTLRWSFTHALGGDRRWLLVSDGQFLSADTLHLALCERIIKWTI